ncbi:MAG: hypothetical protein MZV63_49250 [Marinilabiliales bacterium]|nr:hypothetical protein [Marinilabiliales bacterium]
MKRSIRNGSPTDITWEKLVQCSLPQQGLTHRERPLCHPGDLRLTRRRRRAIRLPIMYTAQQSSPLLLDCLQRHIQG